MIIFGMLPLKIRTAQASFELGCKHVFITSPSHFRSLYLNYEKETSLKDIKLLSYTTFPELFQNYSVNPENKAFCVPECYAAGLLPIGQCIPMSKCFKLS